MTTVWRAMFGFLMGCSLCVSVAAPALAGYGNHAERATVNITTRIEIAKLNLLLEAAEREAIAERVFAKQ